MLSEKILIEGIMPERALSKLARAGICVFHVKKIKKNQILLSVNRKDTEKVFAIYPNVCYNISVYSPYTAKRVGAGRALAALGKVQKRLGLILGFVLFLTATILSDSFVLKIEVTGAEGYERETRAILAESGIRLFAPFPEHAGEKAAAKILTLKDVGRCAVKKSGVTVIADVTLNAFSDEPTAKGALVADCEGTLSAAAVLSGTLLKSVGEKVLAGEEIVGAYLLSENGDRLPVSVVARITLDCVYEAEVEASCEKNAVAIAYLKTEGTLNKKICRKISDGLFFVRLEYTAVRAMNF